MHESRQRLSLDPVERQEAVTRPYLRPSARRSKESYAHNNAILLYESGMRVLGKNDAAHTGCHVQRARLSLSLPPP